MSESSSTSSTSEEAESDRENREAEDDFREMCARAVVRLCAKHHYDMLRDKGHSQRSASSINGHLASRCSGQPWTQVRDQVLGLLPVALQNTLRKEIDLMGENWETPLLPNDAFIIRRSTPEDLPEPEECVQFAKDQLRTFLSLRTDEFERILEVGYKHSKYTRTSIWMEFLVRSMPVDQRISYLNWLGEKKLVKRRRRV